MKKSIQKIKVLLLAFALFCSFNLIGCGESEEIVQAHIHDAIASTGSVADYFAIGEDEREALFEQKHIQVTGVVEIESSTIYHLYDSTVDDFYIKCWFDEKPEGVEDGDILTIDGVCVYSFDDYMSLYGCTITNAEKPSDVAERTSVTNKDNSSNTEEHVESAEALSEEDDKAVEPITEEKESEEAKAATTNNNSQKVTEEKKNSQATESKPAQEKAVEKEPEQEAVGSFDLSTVPAYSGKPYVAVNGNEPFFTSSDLTTSSYESYSSLDSKGRCGVCVASVGKDIMPTEERGSIGQVKPTGWQTVKYDIVDGKYLYNRCHLIGFQLTGENANTKNLITGTRYMNVDGMLPFENMVADYVKETGNHVLYRVTPIFEGSNLVASGVLMEAKSVEDNGDGILFCVYCYNVQPGVSINYANGKSSLDGTVAVQETTSKKAESTPAPKQEPAPAPAPTPAPEPEPAPQPAPEPAPEPQPSGSNALVWKSATGEKYHSINDCGRMNPAKATQITEQEAISMGLGKCTKCW